MVQCSYGSSYMFERWGSMWERRTEVFRNRLYWYVCYFTCTIDGGRESVYVSIYNMRPEFTHDSVSFSDAMYLSHYGNI